MGNLILLILIIVLPATVSKAVIDNKHVPEERVCDCGFKNSCPARNPPVCCTDKCGDI